MTDVHIRAAESADLEMITAIHNDAVAHTTAIWNEETVDLADRKRWFADRATAGTPVLVAVDDSGVLGYATYAQWRPHSGYRHTVEHSVYVRSGERGRGVGRSLLESLIEHARAAGVHVMVAAVESSNLGSIVLHKRLDFLQVGRMPQVGAKFGRWLDLTLLQLILDDRPMPDVVA
ncbi:GNAT family N-acetyltransferase [Leucobacter sp. NPDC058333]|uniref:GNAT family N-acetyltransferase n=1 Tax=Leucobacter sp. NPDC058333 TaxID=3346450 RepID=UPI00366822B5